MNQIRYLLRERAADDYATWNATSDSIRSTIAELTETKTRDLGLSPTKLKLVRDHISWDIMHACMETQYATVCEIQYHRRRIALLADGRCPVGWKGTFPQGKHIVF